MNDWLRDVQSLKNQAKGKREKRLPDYEGALSDLRTIIKKLSEFMELGTPLLPGTECGTDDFNQNVLNLVNPLSTDMSVKEKMAEELADSYGIAGGVYNRMEKWKLSSNMYGVGLKIEEKYSLENSYNQLNAKVALVLADPHKLESIISDVAEIKTTITKQVRKVRKRDYWAWADKALCHLLENESKEALEAYKNYAKLRPPKKAFDTTMRVLDQLKNAFLNAQLESHARLFENAHDNLESECPKEES